jgi:hypothetical protein
VFIDILHSPSSLGLTSITSFPFYLILVDAYSRYSSIYGLPNKSTTTVIRTLTQYSADHRTVSTYEYFDIARIRSDAGSQFTSTEFQNFCRTERIHLSLSAPKKQSQNHLAKRSWQTINRMDQSLLVHAHLPDQYHYHAVLYATSIFNVLPIKDLFTTTGAPSTPYYLFTDNKPYIAHYRIFGCPIIAKKWLLSSHGQTLTKQTERGIRGIFIGFPSNQKGYLIHLPQTHSIAVSGDMTFDESFHSAIATTWRCFPDSLLLQPSDAFIPDTDTILEETGTL